MNISSHQKRLATAAIALPVLAWAIYCRNIPLFMVVLIVSLLGLWEFYTLFWNNKNLLMKLAGLTLGALVVTASWQSRPGLMAGALVTGFWLSNAIFLLSYSKHKEQADFLTSGILLTGLLYVPVTMQFFFGFSAKDIVLVLACAFATDTGAFYLGCRFGKHKMWPAVSPKKSWEGSLGGLAACVAVTLAAGFVWSDSPWWSFVLLGIVLNAAAQIGDFIESAYKRRLNVKDSGTILPGHGGILDRIDSLLLVVPVYALIKVFYEFF